MSGTMTDGCGHKRDLSGSNALPSRWPDHQFGRLIILLAMAMFLHTVDRGNLATAGPLIRDEFRMSNTTFGLLLSAVFWTYVPGQLLAGWLIQKTDAWRTLALGVSLWAVATSMTCFSQGFGTLLVLRLLLGLGECATFPSISKILAAHVPSGKLGWANGVISAALHLGNGAAVLFGGLMITLVGWRPLFLVTGLLSAIWLVAWRGMAKALVQGIPCEVIAEPSYRALLGKRELLGAAAGQFAMNYPYFLLISWLPVYLVKAHGFTISAMAILAGAVYWLSTLASLVAGYASDRWMAAGASANRVRKSMILASGIISIGCMVACAYGSSRIIIAALLIYPFANGLAGVNIFAIGQTLAGPSAAGKWVSVQNCLGSTAGIVAPIVTGIIVDRTGRFELALLVAAVIVLIGMCCWGVVIKNVVPLVWINMKSGQVAEHLP